MDPFNAIVIAVFLPFILAWTLPALYSVFKQRIGWIAAGIAFVCFVLNASILPYTMAGTPIKGSWEWLPAAGISFDIYGDGLAVLLALIVSGIGVIIMSYSNGYMSTKEDLPRYYQWLLLFMGSMLGIAYTDNTIQMFIFWELTSITSFMLIGYWRERPESIYGATKAFLVTAGGGLFMFAGFLLLRAATGTYGISELSSNPELISALHGNGLYLGILILIFIGAASKSAQGPFYIWLPNAMEAPTPVSAFLHSATMVKAGVYLVARMHPILSGTPEWLILVAGTGMITMVLAGFMAFRQTDIKAILAYSTISQLAYLMTMYGYSTAENPGLGFAAATFHMLNHSTFKATLFLVAGIIAHETGTRDIRKLGGLRKEMPLTFIVAVIAAASMAGIPPLNGFLSKEMFYESSLEIGEAIGGPWTYIFPVVALMGGIFTFMYCIKLIDGIFLRERTHDKDIPHHVHEAPFVMLAPAFVLVALIIFFGLYSKFPIETLIQPAYNAIVPNAEHLHVALWHGVTTSLMMTLATFAIGLVLYKFYDTLAAWQNSFNAKFPWISMNYWYDASVNNAKEICHKFAAFTQPGPIGVYIKMTLLFMIFLIFWPVYKYSVGLGIGVGDLLPAGINYEAQPYEIVLYSLMILAALGAALLPRYLPAVISLSELGFLVSLLYIYLKAPDLAMTQVCVETLSTIIFILVLMKIPQKFKEPMPSGKIAVNLLISGVVTFGVLAVMLNANIGVLAPFQTFCYYFIEKSLETTGGLNVVNVIVVDFRGYDTLGEISVLSLAALGVYSLIMSRAKKVKGGKE